MEGLFVGYLFSFVILRPVIVWFSDYSTFILAIMVAVSLLCFFYKFPNSFPIDCFVPWAVIAIGGLVLITMGIKGNDRGGISQYRINFIIYGILPLLYLMYVEDFRLMLKYYYYLSLIATAVIVMDPFWGYYLSTDYMVYGGYMVNYSFLGILIGIFYFKKRKLWILLVAVFGMITLYANKGTIISAIVLLIVCLLYYGKTGVRRIGLLIPMSVIIMEWKTILLKIISMAESLNIQSYAMETFKIMLGKNADYVYSQRTDLWKYAWEMIKNSPFVGYGVGEFENIYKIYPHNLFLEITVTFGMFGLFLLLIITVNSIKEWYLCENYELKLFQAGCFIIMILRLQFSDTFWAVAFFWIYYGIYFYSRYDMGWGKDRYDSR